MALVTTSYNVEGSFHMLTDAHLTAVQGEINTALSTAQTCTYYPQRQPDSYPSGRGWFYLPADQLSGRHRRASTFQMDLFTQAATTDGDDMSRARRHVLLLRDGLMDRWGFKKTRAGYFAYFDLKDWFANPSNPATIGRVRLEMVKPGWRELPDDAPTVIRQQADFKLIFV